MATPDPVAIGANHEAPGPSQARFIKNVAMSPRNRSR